MNKCRKQGNTLTVRFAIAMEGNYSICIVFIDPFDWLSIRPFYSVISSHNGTTFCAFFIWYAVANAPHGFAFNLSKNVVLFRKKIPSSTYSCAFYDSVNLATMGPWLICFFVAFIISVSIREKFYRKKNDGSTSRAHITSWTWHKIHIVCIPPEIRVSISSIVSCKNENVKFDSDSARFQIKWMNRYESMSSLSTWNKIPSLPPCNYCEGENWAYK